MLSIQLSSAEVNTALEMDDFDLDLDAVLLSLNLMLLHLATLQAMLAVGEAHRQVNGPGGPKGGDGGCDHGCCAGLCSDTMTI